MTNCFASCQNENCKSKDTCIRYNTENVIINFSSYMNDTDDKCLYYIKKEIVNK